MPNLVIVESPTKARTLSRFLGSGFQIEATMGHIRDLPEKKLGIEIKNKKSGYSFIPDYLIIPSRRKRVAELKEIAGKSAQIILATDPDREGEAIAWHIKAILSVNSKSNPAMAGRNPKFTRIVFHEITSSAINQALKNPHEIDMNLVNAQQARRLLDRLVGYKLSPLLWTKLSMRWLSAGRVQSVTVRLVVEREREILAFKRQEYWVIDAELVKSQPKAGPPLAEKADDKDFSDGSFIARLYEKDGKKVEIKNKQEGDKILGDLETASYTVKNVEIKEVRRYPYPPFTTSTLQQVAANKFGWSAKRTIRTAQNLYEEGFITYHRTDSFNIAAEALKMVRDYINNVYGIQFLPPSPKFYKTKSKVAQEAHEAIRPTNIKIFNTELGRDADLLYSLIWKRFLACQMNEAVFDQTTVEVKGIKKSSYQEIELSGNRAIEQSSTEYLLKTTGQTMKFAGWLEVYNQNQNSCLAGRQAKLKNQNLSVDNNKEEQESRDLPELVINEQLYLIALLPQQKFTEPPARYTEATLIKTLEEKGIGRPSTYAPIISTIQDRKYVEKIERKFKPTDLGFAVNDFLVTNFPEIFDISFTAKMEDELDEIANGKLGWIGVLNDFYTPFKNKLDQVSQNAEKVRVNLGETTEKCPNCGVLLVVRLSKYGKFLGCPNYPKCKYTKNLLENAGIKCPRCGGEMVVKRTRHGKQFYGCSNYPKCTFAAWKKEEIK